MAIDLFHKTNRDSGGKYARFSCIAAGKDIPENLLLALNHPPNAVDQLEMYWLKWITPASVYWKLDRRRI